jgi:hypothetical protein
MEQQLHFFEQDNEGKPIPNSFNPLTIHGDSAEDRLFKFLLTTIKMNKKVFDILYNTGVDNITDIPDIDLDEWKKILSNMSLQNQKILIKLLNIYAKEFPDTDDKQRLMQICQQLNVTMSGGKKKRKTKKNKKHNKRYRKTNRKY